MLFPSTQAYQCCFLTEIRTSETAEAPKQERMLSSFSSIDNAESLVGYWAVPQSGGLLDRYLQVISTYLGPRWPSVRAVTAHLARQPWQRVGPLWARPWQWAISEKPKLFTADSSPPSDVAENKSRGLWCGFSVTLRGRSTCCCVQPLKDMW